MTSSSGPYLLRAFRLPSAHQHCVLRAPRDPYCSYGDLNRKGSMRTGLWHAQRRSLATSRRHEFVGFLAKGFFKNGILVQAKKFPEEPIGYPVDWGEYGFYQGGPGDRVGESGRYEIRAKLGVGSFSSVWLARDWEAPSEDQRYVKIKILAGFATKRNEEEIYRELEVGKLLSQGSPQPRPVSGKAKSKTSTRAAHACTSRLLDHFTVPGVEESDGEHLCLVNELYPTDLFRVMRNMGNQPLPVRVVQRVLKDVITGLVELHEYGVAHGDLRPNNIMVDPGTRWKSEQAIEIWLCQHPPRKSSPQITPTGTKSSWLSQPGISLLERLESCMFVLSDFGCAQILDKETEASKNITPLEYRAPEAIIGLPGWNEKVDIWSFGVLAFGLLTGRWPIHHMRSPKVESASIEESTLYQMIWRTSVLIVSLKWISFDMSTKSLKLDNTSPGRLRNFKTYKHTPIWELLLEETKNAGVKLNGQDYKAIAEILIKCFRMEAMNRASAKELASHAWLR
ncbi:hypothetical protein NMY22_g13621 [Coprinellus aureogranulatus]|nr:hypothetical protein NMY22_g13621 [Coprinellus aureogranulatus]